MTNPERYHILDEIGRGGMGVVYRAHDAQLGRDVALKLLPATLAQQENALRRFQQEAHVIARLEHPHIVPIYDTGLRHEQPFIVMRFLRGGSLHDQLKKGLIAPQLLWQVLQQIGRALDTTHAQNIIHRDIKPTNVLFDEQQQAYIADFGIAKALDATTQYTGSAIIGSPTYMSPEQFLGQPVTGRSDQYSLAVVAYEALTGQLPFQGNTVSLMYSHLHESPPPIHNINTNLPIPLDAVLQRALAKEPQQRFESIGAFVVALQQAAEAHPLPAIPLPPSRPKTPTLTTSSSQKIQIFYRQGLEAIEKKRWPEAAEAFRQVLAIDPNHTNAKIRYREVEDKLGAQKPSPPSSATPRPTSSSITSASTNVVKGAGGTTAVSTPIWHNKWLWGGAGLLLVLFLFANMSGGTPPPNPPPTSAPIAITTSEPETNPTPDPTAAQTPPTASPTSSPAPPAAIEFMGNVYGSNNYEMLSNRELQITRGDLVIEGLGATFNISNRFGAQVQAMGNSLVGVRYDTGNQQFTVHCLRGSCLVQGDVAGEVALMTGQAVTVGSNGSPGTPFGAQYELFAFASVVPTPTMTATSTATPTATFTATPLPPPPPTSTPMPTATATRSR